MNPTRSNASMIVRTKDDPSHRPLKPHDGVAEVFVCRDCGRQIDLAGSTPDWYTKEDADEARCPWCRGTDTDWLYAD